METVVPEQTNLCERTAIYGNIFTSNLRAKHAEAIIYENDLIIYVGDKAGAEQHITQSTKKVELAPEQLLLPGFVDSHIHFILGGLQVTGNTLETCCSLKELQTQVNNFLETNPDEEWIFANGYNDGMFPGGLPHRKHLDEMFPDKPMALMRFDYHTYLVNTKALDLAGITKDTVDPPFGVVEKDAEGIPTGCLHEKAMDLVRSHFPDRKPKDYKHALETAGEIFVKEGITSYTDALVKSHRCQYFADLYQEHGEKLPRGFLCLAWDKVLEEAVNSNKEKSLNLYEIAKVKEHDKLKINTIKFFVDGVLESKTALLHEPYHEDGGNCGFKINEEEYLKKYVSKLHQFGVQTHFHAVGDKAVTIALDTIEYAKAQTQAENLKDPRHYIAHLQLVRESDYKRFGELNVGTSFTPAWFWDEPISGEIRYSVLGEERAKGVMYPIRSIMEQGGLVSFGSDWPVTTPRPLDGIEVAVTRKEWGKKEGEAWSPEERLSVEEAVLAYTINSAYLCHQESLVGSLEVGKKADLVVLDKDIFGCEPRVIHEAKVEVTVIDGKTVLGKL